MNLNLFAFLFNNPIYLILSVIFLFIFYFYLKYQHIKIRPSLEVLKTNFEEFQKYLDMFYIENRVLSIFYFILYILLYILFFCTLRSAYIYSSNLILEIQKTDLTLIVFDWSIFLTIILFILKYILFILLIYLYLATIKQLFFKHIIGLHIYWRQNVYYCIYLRKLILKDYNIDMFFTYIQYILEYLKTYNLTEEQYYFYMGFPLLRDPKIAIWLDKIKVWGKNNKIIFKLLCYSYDFITHLIDWIPIFVMKIPYILFILIMGFEIIYTNQIYYGFYMLFICIIIREFRGIRNFVNSSLFLSHIEKIIKYFYDNSHPYEKQRPYIQNYKKFPVENIKISKQNRDLLDKFNDDIFDFVTILWKFPNISNIRDEQQKYYDKTINYFVFRLSIIIILLIFNIHLIYLILYKKEFNIMLLNYNINIIISVILLINILLMLIFSNKIYNIYINEKQIKDYYIYIYKTIFIASILINFIFIYIMLIKPNIFFLSSETIFEFIIAIKKIYSVKEKQIFFEKYLKYYMKMIKYMDYDKLYSIVIQSNLKDLFDEKTTLLDIKAFVKSLCETFLEKEKELENTLYSIIKNEIERRRKFLTAVHDIASVFRVFTVGYTLITGLTRHQILLLNANGYYKIMR